MSRAEDTFLLALSAALREQVPEDPAPEDGEWEQVLRLAAEQEVLPLVFDACVSLPSFKALDRDLRKKWQQKALLVATRQIVQTNEFLTLVLHAQAQGLDPVVFKGVVCRNLYPKPMLRPSVDEDLLIPPEETEAYHAFFLAEGLFADNPNADLAATDELSYHRENSPTYIELHKSLFSRSSDAYGELNGLFEGALSRAVSVQAEDVTLRTLAPTDHFLFLLCHAYKHFLHSGIGVRLVADMALFSNAHSMEIDWQRIFDACRSVHMETFAAALFLIAKQYLTLEAIPEPFSEIEVDVQPLLQDMLAGGLYGATDIDRLHSANMTLGAVAAEKQGRRPPGVWRSLFPGGSYLKRRFPYARKYPILLPIAWAQRVVKYIKRGSAVNPNETIRIGQERIALLRQYHIIDND